MKLTKVSTRHKHYSNRHFFSKLLSAFFVTVAVAFGLSLWQSGGALLSNNYKDSRFQIPDSRFFNFSGLIPAASAQSCPLSDPADPAFGKGAIYYNSCVSKFRVYENGWKDLVATSGSSLWTSGTGHSGLDIYNTATSGGDVYMGRGLIVGASEYSTTMGRTLAVNENVIYGVATYSSPYTNKLFLLQSRLGPNVFRDAFAVRLDGVMVVGSRSEAIDPVGGVNGAMYYNTNKGKFRCYEGVWKDCIGAGGGADTLWNYMNGTSGPIHNTNSDGQAGGPGTVRVEDTLLVDRQVVISNVARNPTNWQSDFVNTLPLVKPSDLGCGTDTVPNGNCKFNRLYVDPSSSGKKIAVGPGGVSMYSATAGNWQKAVPYSAAIGNVVSAWFHTSDNTMYAINPSAAPNGLMYAHPGDSAWSTLAFNLTYGTASTSHVWGFQNSDYVYYTGASRLRYYNKSNGDFGNVSISSGNAGFVSSSTYLIGGSYAKVVGKVYLVSADPSPKLTALQVTGSNADQRLISEYSLPITFTPVALSVDETASSCSTCVVLVGSAAAGSDNILIGDGTSSGWKSWGIIKVNGDNITDYNDGSVAWQDAWVGHGGNTIIMSGTKAGVSVVMYTTNASANSPIWFLSRPDTEGFPCTLPSCNPALMNNWYAVSGTAAGTVNSVQFYDRVYTKQTGAADTAGGLLSVAGNILVYNNAWDGTAGSGSFTASSPTGSFNTQLNTFNLCPEGEFLAGLRLNGSGGIQQFYCQKL